MADIYDDIIDRSFKPENLQLKGTIYSSLDSNPDEEAGLHKLAQKTGLPVEALRKDRGAEARRRAALIDTEQLPAEAPKTAEFLADPENARLAYDDLQALTDTEGLFTKLTKKTGPISTLDFASPADKQAARRTKSIGRAFVEGLSSSPDRFWEGFAGAGVMLADFVEWSLAPFPDETGVRRAVADMTRESRDYWKRNADLRAPAKKPGTAESYLQQAGTSIGLSLSAAPYAIAGQGAALGVFGFSAGDNYQELRDAGYGVPSAAAMGVSARVMEGLTEKIGLDKLAAGKGPVVEKAVKFVFGDLAGEEINTLYSALQDKITVRPDMTMADVVQQVVDTAIVTSIAGPVQGVGMAGAQRVSEGLYAGYVAGLKAQENQRFMQALGETAKGSKLRERLPEKFRELVAKIKEDGPVENVYVPSEQWRTFWQERGLDPAEMAQGLNYAEALAAGSDVVIPLEDYATRFAATEHHGELLRDVRLREDQMTPREAEEFRATAAERFGALVEEAEETDSSRQVYEDVYGELIGIGRERSTAEREALLWQARYRARAERLGMDAFELYQQSPLKISRPLPEALRRGTIDTAIDPYLDALRAGELPLADHGPSLLEFMRERGIADDRGDLASMDVDKGRKPFTRKLLREDGMSIDKAREAAVEAGYLSEEADINDLIQAVDAELRGSPVYAQGRMDEEAEAKRQDLEQLQEYLQSMGVDLAEMDNETVRKTLGQGRVMYQDSTDRLSVLHSLSTDNLLFADEMGGLAVPSLAVVPDGQAMEGYGDITLIGTKDLADPEETPVFDADAYTTTFPHPEYPKVKSKDAMKVVEEFRPFIDKFDQTREHVDTIYDNAVNRPDPSETIRRLEMANSAKALFLSEQGTEVEPVMRAKGLNFDFSDTKTMREYFATNPDVNMEGRSEEHKRLTDAVLKAIDEYFDKKAETRKFRNELRETYREAYLDDQGLVMYGKIWQLFRDQDNLGQQEVDTMGTRDALDTALQGTESQFKTWLNDKILGMYGEPFLKIGKRKESYTLENIVAAMTSGKRLAGAEDTMVFGEGKVRATAAHRFKDLEEMRSMAKENILPPDQIEQAREEAKELLDQYRTQVVEYFTITNWRGNIDTWEGLDASMRAIAKWAKSKKKTAADLNAALRKEDFANVPHDILEFGVKAGLAMLKAPVPYFESKPQRAVKLEEFAGAVVPTNPDPRVVEILEKHGIPFVEYGERFDEKARAEAVNSFRRELSGDGKDTLFQTLASDKRASITFGPESRTITFFEKADLSSFLHESGHAWLEELRQDAFRDNAPEQVKEDWQTIAAWLGIDPDQEIPVAAHETFARGIEAYILEGNAPSTELAPVFQRFKAWLLRIYKSLKNLNVTLNKDVRGVMDRLLATDEQIRQAEQMQSFAPLFADAAEAGMSETEFAAYRKIAEAAHEEAARDLQQKLMAELSREQKAWWQEERDKVRAEVEAEAKKNPVYQAFQLLTKGEDFDGKAVEGFKLAKAALVKRYGEAFVKRLPRAFQRVYTKKGGMHPDAAAEVFGFSSGDEMIQAMVNTPPMKQAVEAETDVRMRELYGDMMLDGSIADEAMNSVHSDQRGKVLQAELRALRKKQLEGSPFVKAAQKEQRDAEREGRQQIEAIPPQQAFRLFAAQMIGGKAVKDIRPDLYLKAEQKAGRLAFEAAAKKNYTKAAEEKRKQLLNHFLFMESRKAREEAEKIYDYARKLEKPATQSRIGKAGADYLEQINAILEQYEFKQVTGPALAKRQSLLEWAKQQEDLGLEAAIPQEVLGKIGRRNYKTLSIDALRAVRDALKNIEHLSREANRIRIEGEEIELNEAVRELSASANEHFDPKRLPIDKETRSWIEKKKETLSRLDATLLKAEQLIEWLDGGAVNGPWNRMIFEPLAKAQAREFDLTKEYTQKIAELFQAYGKQKGSLLLEKVYIPALGESLTRQAILSVALNTGNASNYAKLLEGYQWTPEALEQILSHLDGADWAFVQSVWDTIETLWPEIAAMEKRLTGLEPPKVQAREFTNRHGTFRGGYYPVVYDPLHSQAGEKQTDARGEKLFDSTYVRATTEKGHTKARIEQAAYPILLSLEIIPQHLAQVIHDLTHREAVVNANRLLAKTKDTLNATAGPAYHRMLKQWLASVANDRNIDQTGNQFWTQFFTTLRINATIVAMGLRVTTMFTQLAGLSQSLDIVKGRYLAKGLKVFVRHPFESRAWVVEKSGEMRHRSNALDRDIRDGIRRLTGKKGAKAWIQSRSFAGIALFDAMVSTPTWIGAYEQAKAEGLAEKEAIASGDRAVRLSQGAGGAKDLAAVQRSNDLMKLFTMFYSYFSVLYNRLRNMRRLKGIGEIGFMDVAWKSFVMVIFPAVVSELLAGRGPDDDEEPFEWALRQIAVYPFLTLPIVRDVAGSLESGFDYQLTPLARALDMSVRLPGQIEKTLEGEKDVDDLIFQAWDLPGYIFGLPTGQAKKTTQYIWDVWNGDIQPEDGGDIAKGLLFGERRR